MILSKNSIQYFQSLQSRIVQAMAKYQVNKPYLYDGEPFFNQYECLRSVWTKRSSIKLACEKFNIRKSVYYELENRFIIYGFSGLLFFSDNSKQYPDLEQLALLIRKSRPHISYTAIHRFAQAIPITKDATTPKLISKILQSHGHGISDMKVDLDFWGRIQRTLHLWAGLLKSPICERNVKNRKITFFLDQDIFHKRLELLRELFFNPKAGIKEVCFRYGISLPTYYRLKEDYNFYGLWGIFPAVSPGKQSISPELKTAILLERLQHPKWSPKTIIKKLDLKISRFAVHRLIKHWGLEDKNRDPVALDEYLLKERLAVNEDFKPLKSAFHRLAEETLLRTRRINRHFELICNKMKSRAFHICDPGPFLLAPFVNDLGVVQAFETHGPLKLRGKEISNLVLHDFRPLNF